MDSSKILLVDDEVCFLDDCSISLCIKSSLDTDSSGQEYVEYPTQNPSYAVIISDIRIPGISGLEMPSRAKEFNPAARGFKFFLDNFKDRYPSFAYLKIDGAFVKNMAKSINAIGKTMGISTIAEFIGNSKVQGCLKDIEVGYAQVT